MALAGLLAVQPALAAAPTTEELWEIIQRQQAEIEALKSRLEGTEHKVEATAERVEQQTAGTATGGTRGGNWADRTSVGGYGELHYNNLSREGKSDKEEIDFHRFVLFVNHEFNDWIRFYSELELEHALAEDTADGSGPGEVELEQAYVEFDINDRHSAKAGLFLIPVGILNPTHEPNTFYGVERNPIESNIIPTTWWEGGAGLAGNFGPTGLSYDLAVTSGLQVPTTGANAFNIRSGRQKVAKAVAEDAAVTARLRWTGMPGVELAVAGQYQSDLTQGNPDTDATLFEVHADVRRGPFGLRALYARWDLYGSAARTLGRDEQFGWYVEPSYRTRLGALPGELGVFARYNQWDLTAGDAADSKRQQWNLGFNWWPHENVVLKFDYQDQSGSSSDEDGFNLGVGYQF